jgi:ComF family protein
VGSDALRAACARLPAVADAILELLLPRACVVCARLCTSHERELVCGRCWLGAQELPRPRCPRCGHPYAIGLTSVSHNPAGLTSVSHNPAGLTSVSHNPVAPPTCRWCTLLPPFVRAVRSAYAIPGGTAESIVHALKYQGWPAVAPAMARRMAALRFPDDVERERAALVPVPLASSRRRERGYNQSEELARALGHIWHVPVRTDLLARARATESQTRLTPGERHRNVSGAFRARADRDALRGLHLVLVDDVVTTAATLNACAAALHEGGARILSFVTFGRAPAIGDRW